MPPEVAEVRRLMTEFSSVPFPDSCDGLTVGDVMLEVLDSNSIGCISAYVKTRGSLDAPRHQVLRECAKDLESVRGGLPEDAVDYFATLGGIVGRVLEALP